MQNEKRLGAINLKTRLVPVFENAQNYCVPNCTKKKYRAENGEKVSHLKFPDDIILKNLDSMPFVDRKSVSSQQNTKICSRHFKPEDSVKAIGGQRVYVKARVIPFRFLWSKGSPKKRAPPKCGNLPQPSDEDNAFYTGFPNLATFNAVFEFLDTDRKGKTLGTVHQNKELSKRSFTIVETRNQRDVLA